ncbi:hypothetical protein [Streptomyces jeddahensis]|uniref:Uncharacterized protein n=1 Tax=Streptomyces jeddahensis TaxID=1716141 RepID=A0A177HP24_9ACTN|nr:hypothetical protein STSP_37980 [Streptomyces jeddahensis]
MADVLSAEGPMVRLQAALAAGSTPDPGFLEMLIERCAVEPRPRSRDQAAYARVSR